MGVKDRHLALVLEPMLGHSCDMSAPEVVVTNLNPRFTGVSATAAQVVRVHADQFNLSLCGHPLPGGPDPITARAALRACNQPPKGRPFAIWHVRRNPEMRLGLWARDVLRLPVRLVFTSAAIRRHSALPRWLISRMDAVIATTPEAASYVPNVRATVPHGVDLGRWVPAPDRAAAWAATGFPGSAGVATIGRVRPEKGTDRFVATMLDVLPRRPGLTALVIGSAKGRHKAFEAELKQRVADAGLSDRLLFLGEVGPDRLPAIVRGLSALVALPRYEGYGMTPLEAMASAVPFIATDTGYFRAFSADQTAGLIVEPDQASVALTALLADQARLDQMSAQAVAQARAHHSIQAEADGIAQVYHALWAEAGK